MMRRNYLISALHALVLFIWPPGVVMAASVMREGVADVSLALAGVALMLSTLSGITALLWRLERELRAQPSHSLPRPWLLVGSHMACSWLAGALAFALCEAQSLNEWLEVAAVIAASFSGATFVQSAAERLLGKLLPPVSGIGSQADPGIYSNRQYSRNRERERERTRSHSRAVPPSVAAQTPAYSTTPRSTPSPKYTQPMGEVFDTVPAPLDLDDEEP